MAIGRDCGEQAGFAAGLLAGTIGSSDALSERGIAALVRLRGKRRVGGCAGSIISSNVAFRGSTPDPTTANRAVAGSGVDAFAGRGSLAQTPFLPSQSRASGVVSGGERSGSAANAPARTRPPCRCLPSCPAFNIWLEPDQHASVAEFENGAWHIRVPVLVDAHGVAVCETKQLRHTSSVDEIVDVDSLAHSL